MNDLDKILQYISTDENFGKEFFINDIKKDVLPNKNSDQIKYLLNKLCKYELDIAQTDSMSISPSAIATGLTKEFLGNGGFTKIEKDLKKKPLDWYKIISIIVSVIALYLAYLNFNLKQTEKTSDARVSEINTEKKSLKKKVDSLNNELDRLRNTKEEKKTKQ